MRLEPARLVSKGETVRLEAVVVSTAGTERLWFEFDGRLTPVSSSIACQANQKGRAASFVDGDVLPSGRSGRPGSERSRVWEPVLPVRSRARGLEESSMGAWGYGIRQDDFVCDVIGVFEDLVKAGKTVADATGTVKSRFGAAIEDSDDEPLFWIALADVQWTYGGLDAAVLERVKADFESGRSLLAWEEDARGLARRRATLEKFIAKIQTRNPRPKKPRLVVRAPRFQPGDCLSIQLADGRYTAAIVLAADHSIAEQGRNLVGVLDYLTADRPGMDVFRRRKWLVLTHHAWNTTTYVAWYYPIGFRKARNRLEVIGQVEILESDPKDSNLHCGWAGIGEEARSQHAWDAEAR